MVRITATVLWISVLFALSPATVAQTEALPVPPAPPSATRILVGQLVENIGKETTGLAVNLAGGLARMESAGKPSVAVDAYFKSPPKRASDPESFRQFIRDKLVSELTQRGWKAERQTPTTRTDFTIRVALVVDLGKNIVRAEARIRRMPQTIWQRLISPNGVLEATTSADHPMDLESRTILGIRPRGLGKKNTLYLRTHPKVEPALLSSPILAMAISDFNNDRSPELAFLQRRNLLVARPDLFTATVKALASKIVSRKDLGSMLRVNPTKLRHPIASLVGMTQSDGRTLLLAASSDYSELAAFRLTQSDELQRVRAPGAKGVWPLYRLRANQLVGSPWPVKTDVFSGYLNEVGVVDGSAVTSQRHLMNSYGVSAFPHWILNPNSQRSLSQTGLEVESIAEWSPRFAEVLTDYTLVLSDARSGVVVPGRHGTVACLADVNVDGRPELLATSTALSGDDVLTLYTLREEGFERVAEVALTKEHLRGLVTALAFGDIERDGHGEFLVASTDGSKNYLGVLEVNLAP